MSLNQLPTSAVEEFRRVLGDRFTNLVPANSDYGVVNDRILDAIINEYWDVSPKRIVDSILGPEDVIISSPEFRRAFRQ